jgi:hypothetical protein
LASVVVSLVARLEVVWGLVAVPEIVLVVPVLVLETVVLKTEVSLQACRFISVGESVKAPLDIDARAALQELSITRLALELSFFDHNFAARKHGLDDALDLFALVRVVVAVHVL